MTCDHSKLNSRFCPKCGKPLIGTPETLLRYLGNNRRSAERDFAIHKDLGWAEHELQQIRRRVERWAAWIEFVERAIDAEKKS